MPMRLRHLLTALWYLLTSSPYRLLRRSGFFDAEYYLAHNPDVAASGAEPLAHYLLKGFSEQRRPSPHFDHVFYSHQCPDLAGTPTNPLVHFLEKGWQQGLKPNYLVDGQYYTMANKDFDGTRQDPLSHFFRHGGDRRRNSSPSPYFDPHFYCRTYPDAAGCGQDPRAAYLHFLTCGPAENRQPSIFFDTAWYLDKAPGLRDRGFDALSHYFMFGMAEMKTPSPLFDAVFYTTTYGIAEGTDPFGHYLRQQRFEDRRPCAWFDPAFYRQTYLAARQDISPLQHFLEHGLRARLYPNRQCHDLSEKPIISVVVPVYNVDPQLLNTCIRSVVYQSYPHWELCLADDCSTDPAIRPLLDWWASCDPRIRVTCLAENSGISAATNAAAQLSTGSFLAFLDNDDELAPEALQRFAETIIGNPADLYYCDEDLVGSDGRRYSVFRKPSFNRELLLCHNYVTHCMVTRKSLYEHVGGCSGECDGAQDLDLFLKLSEHARGIVHLPEILYHWRASETSTSINHREKHYADEAGRRSVADALARQGIRGEVMFTDWKFFYRSKLTIVDRPSVTLVVNWQQPEEQVAQGLDGLLQKAGYQVSQVILLLTGPASALPVNNCAIPVTVRSFSADQPAAERLTTIFQDIQGELVAFVCGDLEITSDQWLSPLVEYGQWPETGMVTGRRALTGKLADSLATLPDCSNSSPHYFACFLTDCSLHMNGLQCPQQVGGVGGDLFLVRKQLLTANGVFDRWQYPLLFAFLDFSFHLHRSGKKNIYTPYCSAIRNTAGLTGQDTRTSLLKLSEEKVRFQTQWSAFLSDGVPFYNSATISDSGASPEEFRRWLTGRQPPDDTAEQKLKEAASGG